VSYVRSPRRVEREGRPVSPESADQRSGHQKAVALGLFVLTLFLAGYTMLRNVSGELADATADWLVVTAATDGLDPYQDLVDLAEHYGIEYAPVAADELGDFERVHPRTPGALMLLAPLAALPASWAHPFMVVLNLAGLAWVWLVALPRFEWTASANRLPILGALLAATMAFLHTLEYGTHSSLLLLLVIVYWSRLRARDSSVAGTALGVGIALRLFPALLLLPGLHWRRWRAVTASILSFLLLNVAGSIVFDLSPADALGALRSASDEWMMFSGNGSIAMPLARSGLSSTIASLVTVIVGLLGAVFWLRRARRHSWDETIAVLVVVMLLASPLSWDHYDVLTFPVVAWVLLDRERWPIPSRMLAGSWILLQLIGPALNGWMGTPSAGVFGSLALLGRLMLLTALLVGAASSQSRRIGRTDTTSWLEASKPVFEPEQGARGREGLPGSADPSSAMTPAVGER